jgi:hypothetical protein
MTVPHRAHSVIVTVTGTTVHRATDATYHYRGIVYVRTACGAPASPELVQHNDPRRPNCPKCREAAND